MYVDYTFVGQNKKIRVCWIMICSDVKRKIFKNQSGLIFNPSIRINIEFRIKRIIAYLNTNLSGLDAQHYGIRTMLNSNSLYRIKVNTFI